MLDGGPRLAAGAVPSTAFALLRGGGGWLLTDHLKEDQESANPCLLALSCETPNPYKQHLLGTPPPPLWGSREAALKVCLTFSPPLDLLSTESRQLVGRL